jgi:large subunit ribosomal protein L10
MSTPKKVEDVAELEKVLGEARAIVLADFRGLPTPELNQVRLRLREASGQVSIVKNTLLGIAAENIGIEGLDPLLKGPTAMAISTEKDSELAKALLTYIRTSRTVLTIKGGILGKQVLSTEQVETLSTLPPRGQLQATLAGSIQGPLAGFAGIVNSVLSGLLYTLEQRAEKMGEATATPTTA